MSYDIQKLQELLAQATPGPWAGPFRGKTKPTGRFRGMESAVLVTAPVEPGLKAVAIMGDGEDAANMERTMADSALIVAAVNALPAILEDLKKLAEAREAFEQGAKALDFFVQPAAAAALRTLAVPPQEEDE